MADPTVSLVTSGTAAASSKQVTFTAVASGTLLILAVAADTYDGGNPSGWTMSTGCAQETWLGGYVWWRIADGTETSVTYTLTSGEQSVYALVSATNIEGTGSLDISNGTLTQATATSYATPSVSTTSGRRLAVGVIGSMTSGGTITGMGSWTNSYSEVADVVVGPSGSSVYDRLGVATLAFDGGGSTSTGATFTGTNTISEAQTGIILVFKVAAGGSGATVPATAVAGTAAVPNIAATRNALVVPGGTSKQGKWD